LFFLQSAVISLHLLANPAMLTVGAIQLDAVARGNLETDLEHGPKGIFQIRTD
jgi:hypothetical protein